MNVIPAINAIGRIIEDTKINKVVHYFSDLSDADKPALAEWMKSVNLNRKDATKSALERLTFEVDAPAVVVVGRLPEGLNGLLANRILHEVHKPVAVFSIAKSDPSLYVGSLRGEEGFNVMEFEDYAKDYIVKGGGHAFAGGVSIKREDFESFKKAFEQFAAAHPICITPKEAIPLLLSEVTMDTYRELRRFGPFGHDYEAPKFEIADLPVSSLQWSRDGKYLSSPLGYGVKLFSFSYSKPENIGMDDKVTLRGELGLEEYRGNVTLTFRCEKK